MRLPTKSNRIRDALSDPEVLDIMAQLPEFGDFFDNGVLNRDLKRPGVFGQVWEEIKLRSSVRQGSITNARAALDQPL